MILTQKMKGIGKKNIMKRDKKYQETGDGTQANGEEAT